VPIKQKELTALKKEHGNKVIGEVTVDQASLALGSQWPHLPWGADLSRFYGSFGERRRSGARAT
jgi:hypothetical protein